MISHILRLPEGWNETIKERYSYQIYKEELP
jgi:hypothetical protein